VTSPRRVTVYIDGFNLYYGMLKPTPALKWLDLHKLAEALMPGAAVSVRYFTARVKPLPSHPYAEARQRLYLRALDSTPVRVHLGHFITKPTTMALDQPLPGSTARFARVLKTEEKGSDVNLATYLLLDGIDDLYDESIVVSDDSDLAEPITQAAARFGALHVVSPRGLRLAAFGAASTWRALDPALVAASQFPSPLVLPSGRTITKPPGWR
jgi:hypothetical protein